MGSLTILKQNQLRGEDVAFFSPGDVEAQRKFYCSRPIEVTLNELHLNLRVLTLLSPRILHSSSFFFESPLSRELYRLSCSLFSKGDNVFFFSSEVEDFQGHLDRKRKLCPLIPIYHIKQADKLAEELQSYGIALQKKGSISNGIQELWFEDLSNYSDPCSLDRMLVKNLPDYGRERKYRDALWSIPQGRNRLQLVRQFVAKRLSEVRFPKKLRLQVYDRLLEFYIITSCRITGSNLIGVKDLTLRNSTRVSVNNDMRITRYNVNFFLEFLKTIQIDRQIRQLSDTQILEVKRSKEFQKVRKLYFDSIKETNESIEKLQSTWKKLNRRNKLSRGCSQYGGIIKAAVQAGLTTALAPQIATHPYLALATIGIPEIADIYLKKIVKIDQTPLEDFKEYIIQNYNIENQRSARQYT